MLPLAWFSNGGKNKQIRETADGDKLPAESMRPIVLLCDTRQRYGLLIPQIKISFGHLDGLAIGIDALEIEDALGSFGASALFFDGEATRGGDHIEFCNYTPGAHTHL
jgi:hypothetical protein